MKDFLHGIKPVATGDTLPTPSDGVTFFGNSRVDHLNIGGRTTWAFHTDVGGDGSKTRERLIEGMDVGISAWWVKRVARL